MTALRISTRLLCLCLLVSACSAAPAPTSALPTLTSAPPASTYLATQPTTAESPSPTVDPFIQARLDMVAYTIEARGVENADVLSAMRTVPRHAFVLADYLGQAYADHPLPIGYGQTISQPYIVAWMTELLELKPGEKVLEIGTGSGYQAAVLAELDGVEVYTIEIVPELAEIATNRLAELGYAQVKVKQGDGYYGWPEYAPFEAIIVTAAPDHLPAPLVEQLTEGGRLVIPIGPPGGYQMLWKFVKTGEDVTAYSLGGVAFVPLTGEGVEEGSTSG